MLVNKFDKQSTLLVGKVCDAIEAKAFDAEQVTSNWLMSILEENHKMITVEIMGKLDGMLANLQPAMQGEGEQIDRYESAGNRRPVNVYQYNGQLLRWLSLLLFLEQR